MFELIFNCGNENDTSKNRGDKFGGMLVCYLLFFFTSATAYEFVGLRYGERNWIELAYRCNAGLRC